MVHDPKKILNRKMGLPETQITPLSETNNQVFRVDSPGNPAYLLKRFGEGCSEAFQREVGMRECLRRFSDVRFPKIIQSVEVDEIWYVLQEFVSGNSLQTLWDADKARAGNEMEKLGAMLAGLHSIPIDEAAPFLSREEVLYSPEYRTKMVETIAPHLPMPNLRESLNSCFAVVTRPDLEHVVIHADFGPHQVVVDEKGQWVLLDFEYAAIAPFADDLGGTEVRLEQKEYPNWDGFLAGYAQKRPVLSAYEPVRNAFMAFNLLAMLTYAIYKEKIPAKSELERLQTLLGTIS
jgi:Ser/Thr protein kinase RdoA (MazF antagonist)